MKVFKEAMDRCIRAGVEFIIISDDLFDVNIPALQTVKRAAEVMREVRGKKYLPLNTPIYLHTTAKKDYKQYILLCSCSGCVGRGHILRREAF